MKRCIALLTAVLLSAPVYAKTFTIDDAHSNVAFTIRHLVGKVTGQFNKFQGTLDYDAKNTKSWKTDATIDAASITTGNSKRDEHLKTPDFFDVAKFPTLAFKSTGVTDVVGNTGKLQGNLTMHGVTKPVTLDLEVTNPMKDPMGTGERIGATAKGKVNRRDFAITNAKDVGGMIGDEVDIVINIEGVSK